MIIRAIDGNDKDWLFGKGQNDYKTTNDAVAQDIGTRLGEYLADCFFDLTRGVDWFTLLGGKDLNAIKLAVITCILNTPLVVSLDELNVILDPNRNLTLTYAVTTVFGQINDNFGFAPVQGQLDFQLESGDGILLQESGSQLLINY